MKQWVAFWLLGLIWGSSFLLIKIAVEELGVLVLVSARLGIAASLMMGYVLLTRQPLPTHWADILGVIFVGFFNVALPFTLITHAEETIDSSLATILNSTVPLFSLVIAHFVLRDEHLTRNRLLGLLVGYGGIIILASRGLSNTSNSPLYGQAMMLAATLSYAVAVIFMRARLRHLVPITIAGLSLACGAFFIIPLTLLTENLPNLRHLQADTLAAIVTLGVVNTVFAYFLFYSLIDQWGARATLVTYTFPPVGITLGALFLGETIDARLLVGAFLILAGIFVVNYRGKPPRAATVAVLPPQPSSIKK